MLFDGLFWVGYYVVWVLLLGVLGLQLFVRLLAYCVVGLFVSEFAFSRFGVIISCFVWVTTLGWFCVDCDMC